MKALLLVAGHGKTLDGHLDDGVSICGKSEREFAVNVCNLLYERLRGDGDLLDVQIKKVGVDQELTLQEKIEGVNDLCKNNRWSPDEVLLVSLHCKHTQNDQIRGLEAWYKEGEGTPYKAGRMLFHANMTTGLPLRPQPVMPTSENIAGRLGIVDETNMQSIYVSLGYLSNKDDAAYLFDERSPESYAIGLARGIRESAGLPSISLH